VSITLAAPLGIITGPIVARALGPAGRGEVATATVYGNLAWMLFGLGLPWAVGQRAATDPRRIPAVLGTSVRYSLAIAPLITVVAYLLVTGPLDHLSPAGQVGAFILMVEAPLNVFMNCQQAILVGEGALGPMANLRAAPLLFSAVAVIGLAIIGELNIGTYLAVTFAADLLTDAGTWHYLRIRPRGTDPFKPLISFGLRSSIGQLAGYGNRFIDQAILALVVPTRQLGAYAVAATVSALPVGFGQAIAARSFSEVAQTEGAERWANATRRVRMALLVGILASLFLLVVGPIAVPLLFGRAFQPAVVPLLLLLPGTATLSAGLTGVRVLNAAGKPGSATIAELAALGVTAVGLAVAVPTWGIRGAAVVSTLAYWTRLGVMLRMLHREGMGSVRPSLSDVGDLFRLAKASIARILPPRMRRLLR
jgi:O-antigen/teichoic acid export membrane protein